MHSPFPSLIFFPSHPANTGVPSLWELKTRWTNWQIDGWVSGCPGLPLRVSIGLVLYWSDYHSLFNPHSCLISPNLLLQSLKDSVKAGPMPCYKRKVKKKSSHLVVSNSLGPVDCSLPGSSAHGILQARILEWVANSFSRGSSQPRDRTEVSCLTGRHFALWATREGRSYFATKKKLFIESGRYHREHDFPVSHDL